MQRLSNALFKYPKRCQQQLGTILRNAATSTNSSYIKDQELPYGWKVVQSASIPELNLRNAVHLRHNACNAQWLHMENPSDETNAFSVHFKTVPQNSTG